jgi:hypothetical protein
MRAAYRSPMPVGYAVTSALGVTLTEGGLPEIRLVDSHGKVWSPEHDHRDPAEFSGVPRGRYQLRAALRPCDGSCNVLDAPTLRCGGMVLIGDDHELWVRWSGMRACRVARE